MLVLPTPLCLICYDTCMFVHFTDHYRRPTSAGIHVAWLVTATDNHLSRHSSCFVPSTVTTRFCAGAAWMAFLKNRKPPYKKSAWPRAEA